MFGEEREYLTIKILHNDMTVQVPSENADQVGLRRVIGEKEVSVVLKALTGRWPPAAQLMWVVVREHPMFWRESYLAFPYEARMRTVG